MESLSLPHSDPFPLLLCGGSDPKRACISRKQDRFVCVRFPKAGQRGDARDYGYTLHYSVVVSHPINTRLVSTIKPHWYICVHYA